MDEVFTKRLAAASESGTYPTCLDLPWNRFPGLLLEALANVMGIGQRPTRWYMYEYRKAKACQDLSGHSLHFASHLESHFCPPSNGQSDFSIRKHGNVACGNCGKPTQAHVSYLLYCTFFLNIHNGNCKRAVVGIQSVPSLAGVNLWASGCRRSLRCPLMKDEVLVMETRAQSLEQDPGRDARNMVRGMQVTFSFEIFTLDLRFCLPFRGPRLELPLFPWAFSSIG
ncbi:hypothetical protein GGS20DRAFT_389040 [Poronia punctata]|nr:hypothetical protein GGS20DRAFT_389040 [Poronia punctata]